MAQWQSPRYAVEARVVEIMGKGTCPAGLVVGDSWTWKWTIPEDMCPWLAYALFPFFQALSFGGKIPWGEDENRVHVCCIDPASPVVVELERLAEEVSAADTRVK